MNKGKSAEKTEKTTERASSMAKDEEYLKFKELYQKLKEKYGFTFEEKIRKEELQIPCTIFSKRISSLQAITKYLVENLEIGLNEIAKETGRTEQGIWQAYNQSKKKIHEKTQPTATKSWIPVKTLSNKKLSVLENIVRYLKEEFGLNYHKIAVLVKRDQRTVWTVYNRAKKKRGKK